LSVLGQSTKITRWCLLVAALTVATLPVLAREALANPPANAPAKPVARKKAPPKPTVSELLKSLEEQRALIDEQQKLILAQAARIAEQEAKLAQANAALAAQIAAIDARIATMNDQLAVIQGELPTGAQQDSLAERLKRVEEAAGKTPELLAGVVSVGDFPGSMRIPGTDTALKLGGRIRTAGVFTLGPLGSEDRFLTNSIPVEADDEAAGKGRRTTFSANTSRLNFEVRTPAGASYMRAFLEGDFYGSTGNEKRTNFRLRHAFAQFRGFLGGQTWSTFSDPAADHADIDFEGINGENVIRQAQLRYTWNLRDGRSLALAAETPEVSLTGAQGVNLVPDVVGRAIWTIKETGHVQTAVVLRRIRGEGGSLDPGTARAAFAWGASISGVLPVRLSKLTDRFIFQLNFGKGIARYINDLNSLGGQDAVLDDATGDLRPLPAVGWYVDFEHQWRAWETTRAIRLRSSFIWSYVLVDNFEFQPDDAYKRTNRVSANLVFSPIQRIDVGFEYIYGTRENKGGNNGSSNQLQLVGAFRF